MSQSIKKSITKKDVATLEALKERAQKHLRKVNEIKDWAQDILGEQEGYGHASDYIYCEDTDLKYVVKALGLRIVK